jgi:hypothetical protein
MFSKITIATLVSLLFAFPIYSQDTLITANDYKYKIGAKCSIEQNGDYYSNLNTDENRFACFGVMVLRRVKQSKSSFESGLYFTTKAVQYNAIATNMFYPIQPYYADFPLMLYHHYLTIPLNYRLDTKTVYFLAGLFTDINLYHNGRHYKAYVDSIENYGTDRNLYLGWNINLGMEKAISYRFNIFIEAKMAVTVSSLKKEDGGFLMTKGNIGYSNMNYGFGVGGNYKLQPKPK